MPTTARNHFNQDINRAKALYNHATSPEQSFAEKELQNDILRSSWMFAVGSMDAYFCDAYADVLTRLLRAKSNQPDIKLKKQVSDIAIPVRSLFAEYSERDNWRWRIAARNLIEKDNVLSLDQAKNLLNHVMRSDRKLFANAVLTDWILNKEIPQRITGTNKQSFRNLKGKEKKEACNQVRRKINNRFKTIFQRRHDCIHNCDRPKFALQNLNSSQVEKIIFDVEFLILRIDEHLESEFKHHLQEIGCNAVTRNSASW